MKPVIDVGPATVKHADEGDPGQDPVTLVATVVLEVVEVTVTLVAANPAPEKFVPVIVTAVSPSLDPLFGTTLVTVGGAAKAY
jgi:hypothetical protein